MNDISGFGLRLNLVASNTFPNGFDLTQFADDTDPLDMPSIQSKGTAMGLNGDHITWSIATPLTATLAVIPGSDDDKNLAVLFEANRVGRGKQSARDVLTLTAVYPSGDTVTLTEGVITNGPPGVGVASAGRLKTSSYQFSFENKSGTSQ